MNREEALAVAAERKAARRQRTSRIRKIVATIAVAAFIGPFAVIYGHVAAGKDPALANTTTVVASSGSTSASSATTTSATTTTSTPAAVTTQQS